MIAMAISVLIICLKCLCNQHQRNRGQVSDVEDPDKYTNRTIAYPQTHQGVYTLFDSAANNNDLPTYSQVVNARSEQQRAEDKRITLEGRSKLTQSFQLRTINVQQREADEQEENDDESLFN